jgi:hypothetical protein
MARRKCSVRSAAVAVSDHNAELDRLIREVPAQRPPEAPPALAQLSTETTTPRGTQRMTLTSTAPL